MLEDRDYMREPGYRWEWSLTTILLILNAVVFVLHAIFGRYGGGFAFDYYFALSIEGLQKGFLWQPLTFQFMHSGLLHLLGNLIIIYFFGRAVEDTLGKAAFLKIYLGSGIFGGLLQMLASLLLPGHFGAGSVVGASAGAFGLVAAFATLYPERPITLLLFFIIPISFRAKFLLLFEGLLTVFGIIVPFGNIAHVAHLGGLLVGLIFVRWGAQSDWSSLVLNRFRPVHRSRELAGVRRAKKFPWRPPKESPEELPPAEFISKEVDPILDKISEHGIHSLTPQERRILEAASAKMGRR